MTVTVAPQGKYHVVKVNGQVVYKGTTSSEAFRVSCNIQASVRKLPIPFPSQVFPKV